MDSSTYREQTSRPDAFRRATLTDTAAVVANVDAAIAQCIYACLERPPIPKPELHNGGPGSDIFQVALPVATVDAIVDALANAEAGAVSRDGTTTREAEGFATLVDTWLRYRFLLDEIHSAEPSGGAESR